VAYRVFPSGQVPTAEVLQKYLMNQVVIGCTSTSRPPTPIDGMTVFETDTGAFRVWRGGVWAMIAKVGQWDDDGDLHVSGSIDAVGGITAGGVLAGASVAATADVTARGLMVSRLVKGKVGSGITSTNISASTDTNLAGANIQNVPVISGHAYRTMITLDYNRGGGTGGLDRLEFKLWNGTVGGTQLGGTVRVVMTGPLAASNRNVNLLFMWAASSTTTIANLNLSATVTDTSTTWTAEVNSAYVGLVEDLGLASTITNL
jgi:hypothetical protein